MSPGRYRNQSRQNFFGPHAEGRLRMKWGQHCTFSKSASSSKISLRRISMTSHWPRWYEEYCRIDWVEWNFPFPYFFANQLPHSRGLMLFSQCRHGCQIASFRKWDDMSFSSKKELKKELFHEFLVAAEAELPFKSDTQFTTCWRLRRSRIVWMRTRSWRL